MITSFLLISNLLYQIANRANILNSKYHDFGTAETSVPKGPLWVTELGGC
jgi:hypothetical protein